MLIRKIFIGTLVLVIVTIGQLFAQSKTKNSKINTSHETSSLKDGKKTIAILFPDFLQYGLIKKGDTTFSYEYYDKNSNKINMYNLKDIDEVDLVKYFQKICRFPPKENSAVSPPIEYLLQLEFVHPNPDIWLRYDPNTGEITRYNIYKNKIVGTDSVTITDPITNNQRNFIYKYFKTEILGTEREQPHQHKH